MRVLVTGGAGYLGSTLVAGLLRAGHSVRVLDNLTFGGRALLGVWTHKDFELLIGDVRDADTVRNALAGIDAVVHLAAVVGDPACARQPDLARETNLDATLRIVRECRDAQVERFVFASTCSNYGRMASPDAYVEESSDLQPVSLYAETKVSVEQFLLEEWKVTHPAPTCLRFATVFGVSPRMRFDLTVNEFTMELVVKGRLQVYGEQFWRPYVHVADAARAIEIVLEAPLDRVARQVFNVGGTDQNYQKKQLVEMILPYAPGAAVRYVHRVEDPRDYRVSFAKIEAQLGFTLSRSVADGIREVAKLVREKVLDDVESPVYRNSP